MEHRIEQRDSFCVIGFPAIIKDDFSGIGEMWDLLMKEKDRVPKVVGYSIGLEFYPWDFQKEKKFYYMPAFMVKDLEEIPLNMCGKRIPGGRFAIWVHKGSLSNLHLSFKKIYQEYLPASGLKMRAAFDFELYTEKFLGTTDPNSEVEIWIPIE